MPEIMHDKATCEPVRVSLSYEHHYHLFLSHIWGTGQDQVAAVKRQLVLLVPGVSIFLDVDDLEDINSLERYIDETAVVLMFLSKGYFQSRNCLREVVATVAKHKPLVLLWEPDATKGGAPIEALKEELTCDRSRAILEELGSTPEECLECISEPHTRCVLSTRSVHSVVGAPLTPRHRARAAAGTSSSARRPTGGRSSRGSASRTSSS